MTYDPNQFDALLDSLVDVIEQSGNKLVEWTEPMVQPLAGKASTEVAQQAILRGQTVDVEYLPLVIRRSGELLPLLANGMRQLIRFTRAQRGTLPPSLDDAAAVAAKAAVDALRMSGALGAGGVQDIRIVAMPDTTAAVVRDDGGKIAGVVTVDR